VPCAERRKKEAYQRRQELRKKSMLQEQSQKTEATQSRLDYLKEMLSGIDIAKYATKRV
jgi:hypothetical protein